LEERREQEGARRRLWPFAAATALFLILAGCYLALPFPVYWRILQNWGVEAWPTPFLDTDTVLSAVRCLRRGVDVFAANPCDPLRRVYDYSPLWLLLAKLPFTEAWTRPAGLVVDAAFLLSLLLLPGGRDRRAAVMIGLGAVSSAAVFAVERGNNDLVLFVLGALAATLTLRSPLLRACGYGCALLAGLLKYYPMALMALALRERPRGFLLVFLGSCLTVGLFLLVMGHDLVRALRLIPIGSWYGDMFGSSTLPGGLGALFGWPDWVAPALRVALALAALAGGAALASDRRFADSIAALTAREQSFLLAGALLVLGCFFAAQNIGYRAVHLLLVLPPLATLARRPGGTIWMKAAPWLALALLWSMGWRHLLEQFTAPDPPDGSVGIGWFVREPIWWVMVTILLGCVGAILWRSVMVQAVLSWRRRR
jgi:hypothetical protein